MSSKRPWKPGQICRAAARIDRSRRQC